MYTVIYTLYIVDQPLRNSVNHDFLRFRARIYGFRLFIHIEHFTTGLLLFMQNRFYTEFFLVKLPLAV